MNVTPWGASSTWGFKFEYTGTQLKSTLTKSPTVVTNTITPAAPLGMVNYIAIEVKHPGAANTAVNVTGVTVASNSQGSLGPVPAFSSTALPGTLKQVYLIGETLVPPFNISGNIVLPSNVQNGDSQYVQIHFGYMTPPDDEAPIVTNIQVTPNPAVLNGTTTVTATVDDSTTGNSNIASAAFHLNADAPVAMDATDGDFDSPTEDVTKETGSLTDIGVNTVWVTGKDVNGNESGLDAAGNGGNNPCLDFVVDYVFNGFYSPVDNNITNDAKAGQAIPMKWRLTDANGAPISDPASFVGFFTYLVDCNDLSGTPDAIEEYAAGSSGLQYLGEGYWQFNWKTPKDYASTCRKAYVEFNSTNTSPVVSFKFKK